MCMRMHMLRRPCAVSLIPFPCPLAIASPCTPMLRHAPRMQNGRLSLHYAAAKGAPFAVVEALLNANREAAMTKDKACLRVQTAACAVVPPPSRAVVRGALPPAEDPPGTALRRTGGCRFTTPPQRAPRGRW